MANQLDSVCQGLLNDVDDALGAAVVDLESGMILSVAHNIPYFTQSYIDAVAAAAVDMFRGRTVSNVERMLANQRGKTVRHTIKEVQMSTDKTFHFMAVIPNKDSLLVLITGRKANLGMGWASVRRVLPSVEPLCP